MLAHNFLLNNIYGVHDYEVEHMLNCTIISKNLILYILCFEVANNKELF